jgi:ribosomal-protein-alanine N-acetyltransferase
MNPRDAFETFKTFPRIETSRLVLRDIKPSDAKNLFSFMSDAETLKNNLMIPHKKIEETDKFITTLKKQYVKKREIRWGITLKESDTIIGTIGYFNFYPQDFQAEIGVILGKQHWRGGIMTEALMAALTFGFKKMAFNRITIFILPTNAAAIRLATKVGFRQEGLLKDCKFLNDRFYDLGVYGLLKKDFLRTPVSA